MRALLQLHLIGVVSVNPCLVSSCLLIASSQLHPSTHAPTSAVYAWLTCLAYMPAVCARAPGMHGAGRISWERESITQEASATTAGVGKDTRAVRAGFAPHCCRQVRPPDPARAPPPPATPRRQRRRRRKQRRREGWPAGQGRGRQA